MKQLSKIAEQALGTALREYSQHQDAAVQELHMLRWKPDHADASLLTLADLSYWGIEDALSVAADHHIITGAQAQHGQLPGIVQVALTHLLVCRNCIPPRV